MSLAANLSHQDATPEFDQIHSEEILDDLEDGSHLGQLDPATAHALNTPQSSDTPAPVGSDTEVVPLAMCVRAADFKAQAQKVLSRRTWIYITSSANSAQSLEDNVRSWSQVLLRPRILRNVADVSTQATILGHPTTVPFFIPPMGTMGMTHPGAEPEMYRGAIAKGVHAILSTASTKSFDAVMDAFHADLAQAGGKETCPSRLFFQLYVTEDRNRAAQLVRKVKAAGYHGLFLTVDTNVLGKRTEDRRKQAEEALADGRDHSTTQQPLGVDGSENPYAPAVGARPVPGSITAGLCWDDLVWIRREWGNGPIVLKGVQTAEDAKLAAEHGVQGILLSNHGGRQQHTAPSSLATLLEIRAYCPEVLRKMEVYLDGGLYDGADILKALALGATAVGIGRPFLYAMGAYGSKGVAKLIDSELFCSFSFLPLFHFYPFSILFSFGLFLFAILCRFCACTTCVESVSG